MFCYSGAVTLSPSGVAPVCSGDQLELTCTTTGELLQWRFRGFYGNETTATEFTRTITSTSPAMSQLTVNSMVFNFSRISTHNSIPVMSRLVISPVSNGLSGTVMNCVDVDTAEVSSTTIIIGERISSLGRASNLVITSVHYGGPEGHSRLHISRSIVLRDCTLAIRTSNPQSLRTPC